MGMIAGVVLTLAVFVYMFWPEKNRFVQADKTRVDYLRERKDVIYENLRDLNFEYQAGKYPEQDYVEQRAGLALLRFLQKGQRGRARGLLALGGNRVLEIEDQRVGARGKRLGELRRAVAGHEQRGADGSDHRGRMRMNAWR